MTLSELLIERAQVELGIDCLPDVVSFIVCRRKLYPAYTGRI